MKRWAPCFKSGQGNRVIFPYTQVFEEEAEAMEASLSVGIYMVMVGLAPDAPFPVEVDEKGGVTVVAVTGKMPLLGRFAVVAGPVFDKTPWADGCGPEGPTKVEDAVPLLIKDETHQVVTMDNAPKEALQDIVAGNVPAPEWLGAWFHAVAQALLKEKQ